MNDLSSKPLPLTGIIARPGVMDDRNFILASWLRIYENESFQTRHIGHRIYREQQGRIVNDILDDSSSEVAVLASEEDSNTILAYRVTTPSVLHWVHVKPSHLKNGLGRWLLDGLKGEWEYSHETHVLHAINRKWIENNSIRASKCLWCFEPLRRIISSDNSATWLCACRKHIERSSAETPEASPYLVFNPYQQALPQETPDVID